MRMEEKTESEKRDRSRGSSGQPRIVGTHDFSIELANLGGLIIHPKLIVHVLVLGHGDAGQRSWMNGQNDAQFWCRAARNTWLVM